MTFKAAVAATPDLAGSWRAGFGALRTADRKYLQAENTRRLVGSADLNKALQRNHPSDPRWDYAIGHNSTNAASEVVYWVEIHPATEGQVKVVLNKLAWLRTWLRKSAPRLDSLQCAFVWISSGRTSFTQLSPQAKILAARGLRHIGARFRIPDALAT